MAEHQHSRTAPAAQAATILSPITSIDLPAVMERLLPKVALFMQKSPPPKGALKWDHPYGHELRLLALAEAEELSLADAIKLYEPATQAGYVANNWADDIETPECAAWNAMADLAMQRIMHASARNVDDMLARMSWIAAEAREESQHVGFGDAVETFRCDLGRFLVTGVR